MSESALDRTSRALDLVPYLLEHQGISITELAEVFGVTEEQINKDLMLIHMCGLPGYTPLELIDMYYEDGYVTVSEPQSLRVPRRMNRHELAAILVGLDLLKSARSGELEGEISKLQQKLLRNLEVENPYVVIHEELKEDLLPMLESAISKSTAIRIQYLSATTDEKSERNILPLEIYARNGKTYLVAWCDKSQSDRTFRLDRIVNCEVLLGAELRSGNLMNEDSNSTEVTNVKVSQTGRSFIEENQAIISSVLKKDDTWEIQLSRVDQEWLIRTALGYGKALEVTSPAALASEITRRTGLILELYASN